MNKRNPQRGSAMLVTLILISALLAGAAVLVSMQMASNRATELTQTGNAALYCAESGLAVARGQVIANTPLWDTDLGMNTSAHWLNPLISRDLDGDSNPDFFVYLKDNEESDNDAADDVDGKLFLVSRCTKYPDTPKEVMELLVQAGAATCYQAQEGGCTQSGNSNPI